MGTVSNNKFQTKVHLSTENNTAQTMEQINNRVLQTPLTVTRRHNIRTSNISFTYCVVNNSFKSAYSKIIQKQGICPPNLNSQALLK